MQNWNKKVNKKPPKNQKPNSHLYSFQQLHYRLFPYYKDALC